MHVDACSLQYMGCPVQAFPQWSGQEVQRIFYIHSDMQVEGVDVFETFAPVIQWTTVCSTMMLEPINNTTAFVHASLGPNECIYVLQPAGFQCDGNLLLKLKKCVYGIHLAPQNFFMYCLPPKGARVDAL
ncbi:hypothetical protein ACHAW6_005865 [Cyclotella cf. meneghiniana]